MNHDPLETTVCQLLWYPMDKSPLPAVVVLAVLVAVPAVSLSAKVCLQSGSRVLPNPTQSLRQVL